jgi:uncharacterized SAM-binding protein YcdF (DUF218 family)
VNQNKVKTRGRRLRNSFIAAAVFLLFIICAVAFRTSILTAVADVLIVSDTPRPANMIFVLNGDFNTRPFRASELYQQGLAPILGIARSENTPAVNLGLIPNETDVAIGVMETQGVPASKIIVMPVPGGVTSTFDEAVAFHKYAQAHPEIKHILLVTSLFHTRRARWIFQQELFGTGVTIDMVGVPYTNFDQTNWWKNENGLITLNNEYIKLIYYLFKYK